MKLGLISDDGERREGSRLFAIGRGQIPCPDDHAVEVGVVMEERTSWSPFCDLMSMAGLD